MLANTEIRQNEIDSIEQQILDSIHKGDVENVKQLYGTMECHFQKGSEYTKDLIANRFLHPLTSLLEMNYSWGKQFLDIMSKNLKHEYCSQIYSSGI